MRLTPVDPDHPPALTDGEAAPPDWVPRGKKLAAGSADLLARLGERQALFTADGRRALLVVLQARDAGGKDGTVRHVCSAFDPQQTRVTGFAAPTAEEARHDFLWRAHRAAPAKGTVGIFNRSHYEDVLAVRVRGLAPEGVWGPRFGHIADWERMLVDEGTVVVKFFLHVSRAEQARRFVARLDEPAKQYKYDPGDLDDRGRWHAYTRAYQDVFARTSAARAPWYVVPADDKRARNYLVAGALLGTLDGLELAPRALAPGRAAELRAALDAQLAAEEAERGMGST